MTDANPRVLIVDDDRHLLAALERMLHYQYDVETSKRPDLALERLRTEEPFAVILSDMFMPEMSGTEFFQRASEIAPETVRMMLTGAQDQQTVVRAVNKGSIFRFLVKPVTPETLDAALSEGVHQHRLLTMEKQLLGETLGGTVRVLAEMLAIANPAAFGRSSRVRRISQQLMDAMDVNQDRWAIDIAAMLSQIGHIGFPATPTPAGSPHRGLSRPEIDLANQHPTIGANLLRHIPRLDIVAEIIELQNANYDGSGGFHRGMRSDGIPLGARILRVALDFDTELRDGHSLEQALARLRSRDSWYDPEVLTALSSSIHGSATLQRRTLPAAELFPGVILDEDIRLSERGVILVASGQELTPSLLTRLGPYRRANPTRLIRVLVPLDLALDGVDEGTEDSPEEAGDLEESTKPVAHLPQAS